MKIYIPDHLRNIGIIDQLSRMIEEYELTYSSESLVQGSFDDYNIYSGSDPVKNFLRLCISKPSIPEDQDYNEVINYLSKLFYSVKGTVQVFNYMLQYLPLRFDGEIIYDSKEITINFKDLSVENETLFYNLLKKFLDALIYYTKLNTNISSGSINLTINSTFQNYIGANLRSYNKTIVMPYEIDY